MKMRIGLACVVIILALATGRSLWADAQEGLLFHAGFDGQATADLARGNGTAVEVKGARFAPGVVGQAAWLGGDTDGEIVFAEKGNIDRRRGSLEIWVNSPLAMSDMLKGQGPITPFFLARTREPRNGLLLQLSPMKVVYMDIDMHPRHWYAGNYNWGRRKWFQLVVTWDNKIGARMYVNGKFVPGPPKRSIGGVMRYAWKSEPADLSFKIGFIKTGRGELGIDEVRIWNRELSEDEVRERYLSLCPVRYTASPRVVYAGKATEIIIKGRNFTEETVTGDLLWEIRDEKRTVVCSGEIEAASILADKDFARGISIKPEKTEYHSLALRMKGFGEVKLPVYVIEPHAPNRIEVSPHLKLSKVDEIICGKTPEAGHLWSRGDVRVVDSPLGKYWEADPEWSSRLAFKIDIPEDQVPYILRLKYPDDKFRSVMSDAHDDKTGLYSRYVTSGYITGGRWYPNTHTMQSVDHFWYPTGKTNVYWLLSWLRDAPAAAHSVSVFKIEGGNRGIPRLKVNTPEGEPGREFGIQWEDSVFGRSHGVMHLPIKTHNRDIMTERLTTYMGYLGLNCYHCPAMFYSGPLYFHSIGGGEIGTSAGAAHHCENWLELTGLRMAEAGIKFYPTFNCTRTPNLIALKRSILELKKGADTVTEVRYDGAYGYQGLDMNPLHPAVQKEMKNLILEVAERGNVGGNLGGVGVYVSTADMFCFQSLRSGYGDLTVGLFERETGITVPGDAKDYQRFFKRAVFLTSEQHRKQWVDWRCRKVGEVIANYAETLDRAYPGTKFILSLHLVGNSRTELFRGEQSIYDAWRERGIDMLALSSIPNVEIEFRWHESGWGIATWGKHQANENLGFEPYNLPRDVSNDPVQMQWLKKCRAAIWDFRSYYERQLGNKRGHDYALCDDQWWVDGAGNTQGDMMPPDRYALEPLVRLVALTDTPRISVGAISTPGQGRFKQWHEFARAFRSLPKAEFTTWTGSQTQPVWLREYEGKAGHYFYAANTEYYPVPVEIAFSGSVETVKELSLGKQIEIGKDTLSLKLKPFELKSFLVGKGAKITAATVNVPSEPIEKLKKELSRLKTLLKKAEEKQARYASDYKTFIARIDKALAEKRYYDFRRLIESNDAMLLERDANRTE